MTADGREFTCDICSGPLGQQRWRGFFPICTKCELDSIHDTPGITGPYLDAYNQLRDLRNMLADAFRNLEEGKEEIIEGDPLAEVIDQIADLSQTFLDSMVKPAEEFVEETT
ncbi:MAG: hypothetical protein NVS2B16_05640 [Chloroflexota bacterium]